MLSCAEEFDSSLQFDCVTSSYLAKYADLSRLVANSRKLLRRGGVLMVHDFTFPPNGWLVAVWRAYFFVMRNSVARIVPEWKEIYDGLPRLIEETRWTTLLQDELAANQFTNVKLIYLTLYGSAIVTAVKG